MATTNPDRWEILSNLLGDILEAPPEQRDALIVDAGKTDESLSHELRELLEAYDEADREGRFESGVGDLVSEVFPEQEASLLIGPYKLQREVGRGGMGSVWLAERADGLYEQQVAVKLMHAGVLSEERRRRFKAERRILARLNHPNIARILDGGVSESGRPYLVMEYVEGTPLTEYCAVHKLGVHSRLALFRIVCSAVAYAHQNLIVHRDLKPSNILVTSSGEVKLLDFGIAKLLDSDAADTWDDEPVTDTGMAMMTPEYAAPEQITGDLVTTSTDVYALGVVLFELLTGQRPYTFEKRSPAVIMDVVCNTDPPRPSRFVLSEETIRVANEKGLHLTEKRLSRALKGDLDTIILHALRKQSHRRYISAANLEDDIRRHLVGLTVSARPDTAGYRIRMFVRRHRVGVMAATAVALALIVGLGVSITQTRMAIAEREKADAVSLFLKEMLASADPYQDGPEVRVVDLLERAGEELPERFSAQPDLEASLQRIIGVTYLELGMYDEARGYLDRANVLLERIGDYGAERIETWVEMGRLARLQGEYERADSLFTLSFSRVMRQYGEQSPQAVDQFVYMGSLHWYQGRYDEADSLVSRAFEIQQSLPNTDSLQFAPIFNLLAGIQADIGNTEEAEALYRRELAILRHHHGNDNPDVAQALTHIGIMRAHVGDINESRARHEEALEIYKRVRGEQHPNVAYAMENLASTEIEAGNLERADSLQQAAIEIQTVSYGEAHPIVGIMWNNRGSLLRRKGESEEGLAAYRKALDIWREGLGDRHPYVGYGLHNVGNTLLTMDRVEEAIPYLEEAYELRSSLFSPDHSDLLNTTSIYGSALVRIGQVERGEMMLRTSHQALLDQFGPNHVFVRHSQERMDQHFGIVP